MFGAYGIYSDSKIFSLICHNKLFTKPSNAGREYIGDVEEVPTCPGAKPSFLIEDKIEIPIGEFYKKNTLKKLEGPLK